MNDSIIMEAIRCEDRRRAFEARLRGLLANDDTGLHAATMGRDGGGFVWILTLQLPRGILTAHVPIAAGMKPTADATADAVAARVGRFLHERRALTDR